MVTTCERCGARCGNHCWTAEDMRREAIEHGFDPDGPNRLVCDECYAEGLALIGMLRLLRLYP